MKLANLDDRLVLALADGVADVATVSNGRFGPDPMSAFDDWTGFVEWAARVTDSTGPLGARLRCSVPRPRQVFAIGLNYRSHAEESNMAIPEVPATFTKFPASLSGPFDEIDIFGDAVAAARPSPRELGRRHRHDPQPCEARDVTTRVSTPRIAGAPHQFSQAPAGPAPALCGAGTAVDIKVAHLQIAAPLCSAASTVPAPMSWTPTGAGGAADAATGRRGSMN